MRIAQVAPLAEAVPPRMYGGTERVVSWLVHELDQQGHEVTTFASGDSEVPGELVTCAERGLRLAGINDHIPYTIAMLDEVRKRAHEFDIIHFHIDVLQFPTFRRLAHKCVTTLHGRLDLPDVRPAYQAFPFMPVVSLSWAQRKGLTTPARWVGNVYHGLPEQLCPFHARPGGYLAFLGRIAPEKRVDRAIEIAKRAGLRLKIAAKVDRTNREYFRNEIEPLLKHPLIEFIGEIGDQDKGEFLGGAIALLFPIDWPEPFGLVMIEAMSTGTPVIAWRCGSVPEVVEEGLTGYIVSSVQEAVEAIPKAANISRAAVRWRFLELFTASRMAFDYCDVYERLLSSGRHDHNYLESMRAKPDIDPPDREPAV